MQTNWKKNVAIFMSSQAISIFGSSLVQFAITAYITVQTKSGLYATLAILCAILPTFFLSPFAGVWADKFNRKTLIMLADGGIAACTLLVAILFLMGHGSIWLLYVALVIRGLGSAIQTPCVGAMLPDVVPEEHLTRVNGINGSLNSLFTLASPMLGALLLGVVSLGVIFFVDIITAIIAIALLLKAFVLPDREKEERAGDDYLKEMKLGVKYIARTKFLKEFFVFCIVFYLMMAPAAFLTQVQVVRNYGDDVWRLSVIEMAFSIGMLVGGLTITAWGGFRNRVHTMILSTLMMGLCTLALGIKVPFIPYVGFMTAFGIAMPLLNTPAMVLLQERVEPQYMGRVFGVITMLNSSIMPLGMVIFGPIADYVAIEYLLFGTGAVMLIATAFMTRTKALLTAGTKAELA